MEGEKKGASKEEEDIGTKQGGKEEREESRGDYMDGFGAGEIGISVETLMVERQRERLLYHSCIHRLRKAM